MDTLPKVELHVHLEAAITVAMAKQLAKQHSMHLPERIVKDDEYFHFTDYLDFIESYDVIANVVKTRQDYFEITYDYLIRSAKEGVIYTEFFLSSQQAHANNISYDDMLSGAIEGIEKAKQDCGIDARIIMVFVKHLGPKASEETAREIAGNLHPYIVGVTMAGAEQTYSNRVFDRAFDIVYGAGLKCTTHVGEVGSAADIWEAIECLPVVRLGHGVKCADDEKLMQTLIDRNIALEVCPTSNVFTGAYKDYAAHPLAKIYRAGIPISINSDDPTFFNTTIGNEYAIAKQHFGFSDADLLSVSTMALDHAFADEECLKAVRSKLTYTA